MVTIDPADEAPEELTGAEFIEYMKNKKPVPTASVADEEVEAIAKPAIKGKRVGEMQPYSGRGKKAGEATGYGGHEGIDASKETFESKHPKLAKAVDIGKKVVGVINKKTAGYVKDTEDIDKKLKELQEEKEEEREEIKEKKSSKKKSKSKSKNDKFDLDFDDEDEDDEDITALNKATSKQKVLPGNYKPAFSGSMGGGNYKSAFTSPLGSDAYQPAYKTTAQTPNLAQHARGRVKESEVEEEIPQPRAVRPPSDRFNIQNWQSMGFPNTLPQSARGNLFGPAPPRPQPTVVPMVRQPYQPRPTPTPMRPPTRAPMSGPMPKIGFNFNTIPQIMKPRTTVTPPRAQAPQHVAKTIIPTAPTFFGVNLNEKKKLEPKPITNMGAGYKNVPLTVMDGLYPKAKYDPKKDPITKKSIIPKIQATITPNNFTMFGMRMKNRKL